MAELIYKELSYKISGLAFEVFRTLGGELREKVYADAFEELLKRDNINYLRELYYPIKINNKVIGKNYFDFFVDNKIVVEIKRGNSKYYQAYNQLLDYIRLSDLKLGLIIRFAADGAKVKRIINIH